MSRVFWVGHSSFVDNTVKSGSRITAPEISDPECGVSHGEHDVSNELQTSTGSTSGVGWVGYDVVGWMSGQHLESWPDIYTDFRRYGSDWTLYLIPEIQEMLEEWLFSVGLTCHTLAQQCTIAGLLHVYLWRLYQVTICIHVNNPTFPNCWTMLGCVE